MALTAAFALTSAARLVEAGSPLSLVEVVTSTTTSPEVASAALALLAMATSTPGPDDAAAVTAWETAAPRTLAQRAAMLRAAARAAGGAS